MGCKLFLFLTALVCFHLVVANQDVEELNRNWVIDQLCNPILSICDSLCHNLHDDVLDGIKWKLSSVIDKVGVNGEESKVFKNALFGLVEVVDQGSRNLKEHRVEMCSLCQEVQNLCNQVLFDN
ncbi:uncharacterized protein [Onthophagus taurus]|uniref:uncharacterized protein n=1 Tax=Onthophagus taurus TaxID=166361 RepID=UPI000C204A80|nr:uncharacterized protein LOC111421505 [Onthophagus taurus]